MRALRRKLWRELWQMRMQLLSIALVVAAGVMTVITMRGSYETLSWAQSDYYRQTRFAELWAPLVRAPVALAPRLQAIPGVATVDTRITLLATLDLPALDMPALGRFVSLPAYGRPLLNDIRVLGGRYLPSGETDAVLISEKFSQARGLGPGDVLRVVINGRAQELRIVGVASSAEHSYAVPPGSLMPENERYGVFWVSEQFLGPAFDMDGAFNEAVLALDPDADVLAVQARIDALLEPYGGLGAYPRSEQLSHVVLENELDQVRVMGTVIPGIFLAVAVFLLHQVLGRLIATQRGEIAVLKAFGYSDRETGLHYLMYALLAVGIGSVLGGVGGLYLGEGMVGLYAEALEIPGLEFRVTPTLLLLSIGLSLLGACSGALGAVRRAVRLPPAEAMRAEAPGRYRPGPLETLGLGRLLPASGRMVLRNLERRPLHALMSVTGVASAMAILVVGMFMFDSAQYFIDLQFRRIQREDLALVFDQDVGEGVRHELERLPGVTLVETWRAAPARLRNGHLEDEVAVIGLEPGGRLRRLVDRDGVEQPLPAAGVVLSTMLADKLRVVPGGMLALEWLSGERLHTVVQVTGVTEDFIGLSAYMSKGTMNRLSGTSGRVSGAHLLAGGGVDTALYRRLKQTPGISGVSSPAIMVASFQEQLAKTLDISTAFLLGFAGVIAFGVIYNSARIALSERGRELATLRVMGFHRDEVATLLLGEQGLITAMALLPGGFAGYWLARGISAGIESESYRIPFVAVPQTYLLAAAIIVLAALASTLAVRRRLDKVELVSVLKARE